MDFVLERSVLVPRTKEELFPFFAKAENLDLLATNETASIYNNVILTSERGSLWADQVDYDFNNEKYQVSMFNNKGKVKIKLIE